MKLLELFAGSRSIGKVADTLDFNVFSVDWEDYEGVNLCLDIGKLQKRDVPFVPDVIWASPDCTTYTIAACSTHRTSNDTTRNKAPKSDYAKKCDSVNKHWLKLINEWLEINPNLVYFIENPRGMLRHMDFMKGLERKTVWYCQYGDDRAKPTDIWTNSKKWKPRKMCHNYKYDKEGLIVDKHCHHESARRGAKTGTQGIKGAHKRSIIPEQLCVEIIESCI